MSRPLHQEPDWPALTWDAASLSAPLAAVRFRQGRLSGRVLALDPAARATLLAEAMTADAEAILDGTATAFPDVLAQARTSHRQALTAADLLSWHAALVPDGGQWRTTAGRGPPPARLPAEMDRFLAWAAEPAEDVDAVLHAGLALLHVQALMPFATGTGAIARAVALHALARAEGTPPAHALGAVFAAANPGYAEVLNLSLTGGTDVTTWLFWFLLCLDRAVAAAEARVQALPLRAATLDPLHPRQAAMLDRLRAAPPPRLTSTLWAELAGCSPDTALRDITDLMRRRLLRRAPGGGRSTTYALVEG